MNEPTIIEQQLMYQYQYPREFISDEAGKNVINTVPMTLDYGKRLFKYISKTLSVHHNINSENIMVMMAAYIILNDKNMSGVLAKFEKMMGNKRRVQQTELF